MSAANTQLPLAAAPTLQSQPAGAADPVLQLVGVTKSYPGEPPVEALRGVDLAITEGELVGVVGPSGSGKSTLLHVMGTLDRPTSGVVCVDGHEVSLLTDRELAALRAQSIGFVFQQFFLSEAVAALDNVADGLLYTGLSLKARSFLAAEALERVGLSHRANFRPAKLSGGERQRVAIARAVAGRPAIVLADEPTGNLDSATGSGIFELLRELNDDGTTIVVITHERDLAGRLPRRVDVLDGRVVSDVVVRHEPVRADGSSAQPAREAGPMTQPAPEAGPMTQPSP
jgi:putative ABC transport system ATP-binding protein